MSDKLRLKLLDQVLRLPDDQLKPLDTFLGSLKSDTTPCQVVTPVVAGPRDWPHAPLHRLSETGTYIVTASTYEHLHYFRGADRLDHLEAELLRQLAEADWHLEAWAVFSNHYHYIVQSTPKSGKLTDVIKNLHGSTSRWVNQQDGVHDRMVWDNYWDTELTIETSYLARLHYVHQNPERHRLVKKASEYRWCSAAWFERTATRAQVQTIYSFKIDKVKVPDDFDPVQLWSAAIHRRFLSLFFLWSAAIHRRSCLSLECGDSSPLSLSFLSGLAVAGLTDCIPRHRKEREKAAMNRRTPEEEERESGDKSPHSRVSLLRRQRQ